MNVHEMEARARAEENGFTRTSSGRCPRRLAGKRHIDLACWCITVLNDHSSTYQDIRDGKKVVIWEPYNATAEELGEISLAADGDDLDVDITGRSFWSPGSTFAIIFKHQLKG